MLWMCSLQPCGRRKGMCKNRERYNHCESINGASCIDKWYYRRELMSAQYCTFLHSVIVTWHVVIHVHIRYTYREKKCTRQSKLNLKNEMSTRFNYDYEYMSIRTHEHPKTPPQLPLPTGASLISHGGRGVSDSRARRFMDCRFVTFQCLKQIFYPRSAMMRC